MSAKPSKFADALGAKVVATIADTGPGAFGASRLQHIVTDLRARLQPSSGDRPGRPTESSFGQILETIRNARIHRLLSLTSDTRADGTQIPDLTDGNHFSVLGHLRQRARGDAD